MALKFEFLKKFVNQNFKKIGSKNKNSVKFKKIFASRVESCKSKLCHRIKLNQKTYLITFFGNYHFNSLLHDLAHYLFIENPDDKKDSF